MKVQATTIFICGLLSASVAMAQGGPGGNNDFLSDGPFAFHVKGKGGNSSIDGYLTTLPTLATEWLLQYEAGRYPKADNSSYRFYFNYTGRMQSQGDEAGFFVTDYVGASTNPVGLKGKAMSLRFDFNTNVGLALLGAGTAALSGFNADTKAFLAHYMDDSTYVPGHGPATQDYIYQYQNWAVCWQPLANVYAPVLSWVTTGRPHNPTCELVDLSKVSL
ncbi:hypothetical protein F4860DRAFT_478115 [Xylaria cubensis]|nr:hypothetical protein F4860DRAFT_478115 [Xylaria cubensis]